MAGKIIADTLEHSTAGSVDTQYVALGAITHALHYNQISATTVKSWNTSSVVDAAAGRYNVTVTSAYSDANSIFTVSCNFETNGSPEPKYGGQLHSDNSTGNEVPPTTTTYTVRTDDDSGDQDLKYDYTTRIGDLA